MPTADGEALRFRTDGLTKVYGSGHAVQALRGVNLELPERATSRPTLDSATGILVPEALRNVNETMNATTLLILSDWGCNRRG